MRKSREWWTAVSPWLKYLITFLKFGVPMGHAIRAVVDALDVKNIEAQIVSLERITDDLPDVPMLDSMSRVEKQPQVGQEQMVGPALRALHSFLLVPASLTDLFTVCYLRVEEYDYDFGGRH